MRFLVTALVVLMAGAASSASAGIFTVREGTKFYAKPSASEDVLIDLPEVRVQVPPLQDERGFCRFTLVYKIADQGNPDLPASAWARSVSTDRLIDSRP